MATCLEKKSQLGFLISNLKKCNSIVSCSSVDFYRTPNLEVFQTTFNIPNKSAVHQLSR